jgi:hypothetical protein
VFDLSQEHQMGITFFTLSGLFAPLQQFVGWLSSAPLRKALPRQAPRLAQPLAAKCAGPRAHAGYSALPARRPLRVVRVVDACHAPASAGRRVISGRMADVCAELDRLAALEVEMSARRP